MICVCVYSSCDHYLATHTHTHTYIHTHTYTHTHTHTRTHTHTHIHTYTHTQTTTNNTNSKTVNKQKCYETKRVSYEDDFSHTSPPAESDIHSSTSPASEEAQARQHSPDSGIALSGYQSSHSGNESLSPSSFQKNAQESTEAFCDGQIVATVNPDIQAARRRSQSLPELNSNVTTLSFVPNSSSSPPPLIMVTSNSRPTSSIASQFQQHGRMQSRVQQSTSPPRARLYSSPPRGMIPLSHAPTAAANPTLDGVMGKFSAPSTFSLLSDKTGGFASATQGIPSYQSSSLPYPGYGAAYGSPPIQPQSMYSPTYNAYAASPAPHYLPNSPPCSSSFYHSPGTLRSSIPPPYGTQHIAMVPTPPTTSKPLGFMSYSTSGHAQALTTLPLPTSSYSSYSPPSNPNVSPYASYNTTVSSSGLAAVSSVGLLTTSEAPKLPKPIAPKTVSSIVNQSSQNCNSADLTKITVGAPRIIRKSSRVDSQSSMDEGEDGAEVGSRVDEDEFGEQQQLYTKT